MLGTQHGQVAQGELLAAKREEEDTEPPSDAQPGNGDDQPVRLTPRTKKKRKMKISRHKSKKGPALNGARIKQRQQPSSVTTRYGHGSSLTRDFWMRVHWEAGQTGMVQL